MCLDCLKVTNHKEKECDGKYKNCLICKELHNTNLHARKDSYPAFQKLKEEIQWQIAESCNNVPTSSESIPSSDPSSIDGNF